MEVAFGELIQLFWWATATIAVVAVLLIAAFALAAFAVFRTRRDGPERLMLPREKSGDAGVVDDDFFDPKDYMGSMASFPVGDDEPPDGEDVMGRVASGNAHRNFMNQWQSEQIPKPRAE